MKLILSLPIFSTLVLARTTATTAVITDEFLQQHAYDPEWTVYKDGESLTWVKAADLGLPPANATLSRRQSQGIAVGESSIFTCGSIGLCDAIGCFEVFQSDVITVSRADLNGQVCSGASSDGYVQVNFYSDASDTNNCNDYILGTVCETECCFGPGYLPSATHFIPFYP
ncbi:hypothetical protein BX600DRAFT_519334 [Xylariales sp. PMI_506]|nr:hypothetical protein BX600DRAFT_519334 [Xylariales sp. PMI_506]